MGVVEVLAQTFPAMAQVRVAGVFEIVLLLH